VGRDPNSTRKSFPDLARINFFCPPCRLLPAVSDFLVFVWAAIMLVATDKGGSFGNLDWTAFFVLCRETQHCAAALQYLDLGAIDLVFDDRSYTCRRCSQGI
jgi:hypothetical protein